MKKKLICFVLLVCLLLPISVSAAVKKKPVNLPMYNNKGKKVALLKMTDPLALGLKLKKKNGQYYVYCSSLKKKVATIKRYRGKTIRELVDQLGTKDSPIHDGGLLENNGLKYHFYDQKGTEYLFVEKSGAIARFKINGDHITSAQITLSLKNILGKKILSVPKGKILSVKKKGHKYIIKAKKTKAAVSYNFCFYDKKKRELFDYGEDSDRNVLTVDDRDIWRAYYVGVYYSGEYEEGKTSKLVKLK